VAQLIQQNEELRQRRPESSHLEVNPNGHSKERENQHQPTGGHGHVDEGHSCRKNDNNGDNSHVERNGKLTTTQPSEVDKALIELKIKMATIEKKEARGDSRKQTLCGNGNAIHQMSGGVPTPEQVQITPDPELQWNRRSHRASRELSDAFGLTRHSR
jgi:hypothetical protein